ncbi:MAG: hypothetical protein O2931_12260 [Planctomycetota bacterium]|nr:hypothetical protein [Planctomycetota bacterium]MDA1179560.1 hypothetical protein [Planctomycetota bacterium]
MVFKHLPSRVVVVLLALAGSSQFPTIQAQDLHRDVIFRYQDSKILLDLLPSEENLVSQGVFRTSGISQQFTSYPGFASESDVGFGINPNDTIVYNVLDRLLYSNGAGLTTPHPDTAIVIRNVPSSSVPDTTVSGSTGEILGGFTPLRNRIGASSGSGDFHSHVSFELTPTNAPGTSAPTPWGAYGLKLSLSTSAIGVADSDPFLIVFNFGLDSTAFDSAVIAMRSLLGSNPICDLTGDSRIDGADVAVVFGNWNIAGIGDCNQDGSVDGADLAEVYSAWTGDTSPAPMTVPEPPTHLLLATVVSLAFVKFNRRGGRVRRTALC